MTIRTAPSGAPSLPFRGKADTAGGAVEAARVMPIAITEARQYAGADWNPTAAGDLEALRSVWDTNGDGKLTAADTEFAKFKVMVTNADGSTTVMTLTQLGITEIDLTANATRIEMPDGLVLTGHNSFTRMDGRAGRMAKTTPVAGRRGGLAPNLRLLALTRHWLKANGTETFFTTLASGFVLNSGSPT